MSQKTQQDNTIHETIEMTIDEYEFLREAVDFSQATLRLVIAMHTAHKALCELGDIVRDVELLSHVRQQL